MSVIGYTGAAGTGKTTRLVSALESVLTRHALREGQRVLALTRMHGSRHRLIERLQETCARGRFDCFTFERLAWEIVSRWRTRAGELGYPPLRESDYDRTCEAAAALLTGATVVNWVRTRYPVVLVDELQDCREARLEIVQALGTQGELLVAADEFQDLYGNAMSPAVEWLRRSAQVEELAAVHRTSQAGLLSAARALRNGWPLQDGPSLKVLAAPNANVAASQVARGISWRNGQELVVISAVKAETSPFIRDVLARLAEKPFKSGEGCIGPYEVPWEQSREGLAAQLMDRLDLPGDDGAKVARPRFKPGRPLPAQRELELWIQAQENLRGDVAIECAELRAHVHRSVQHLRSLPRQRQGLRAMTIHQAKNREFERVLVLWPVHVKSDPETQRRLLYNAITRAKRAATVVVQDPSPKSSRLWAPPFSRPRGGQSSAP